MVKNWCITLIQYRTAKEVIKNWGCLHLPITLNTVQHSETNSLYSASQLIDYDRSTTKLEQRQVVLINEPMTVTLDYKI